MTDTAIDVQNLGKRYRIGVRDNPNGMIYHYKSLRDTFRKVTRQPWKTLVTDRNRMTEENSFWALKDISLQVKRGEVVGIIGRNGAGKSTLLKILSRITKPTTGKVDLYGRVGSLLEVGTGFHPELTGRENIFLNGAVLGMTRGEVKLKFDEIVAFSEIERFIDTPVKQYSSGMYMRLAFAVAAHLEPEILVVDEVLSVGDAAFQKKCLGKMKNVAGEGRTVLFVSHDMGAVCELCTHGIYLADGKICKVGTADVVTAAYASAVTASAEADLSKYNKNTAAHGLRLGRARFVNAAGESVTKYDWQEDIRLQIEIAGPVGKHVSFGVTVNDPVGRMLFHVTSQDEVESLPLVGDVSILEVTIPRCPLNDGTYTVSVLLGDRQYYILERAQDCLSFEIDSSSRGRYMSPSPIRLEAHWTTTPAR